MRIAAVTSHPIQYQAPWFRGLAARADLHVYFAHRPTARDQARAGYGVDFEWDVDLLSGYPHTFLRNVAASPNVFHFNGCDTPDVGAALRTQRPDACIVPGWYLRSYWQAIRACRALGIPVFVRGDSQLDRSRPLGVRAAKEIAYRAMMRQFDAFLCVGKRNTEYVLHYGAPRDRAFFVPHFVDNAFFAEGARMSSEQRRRDRAALGIGEDAIVVMFVGRFTPTKSPQDILRALARLRAARSDLHALFVGAGELERELRALATKHAVSATFVGFRNQSELPRTYALGDMLVLPSRSRRETWGLVVNEAMASGIPAIVSDCAGCGPDLIGDDATGVVFPHGDVDALAGAVSLLAERRGDPAVACALQQKLVRYSCATAVDATLKAVARVTGGT